MTRQSAYCYAISATCMACLIQSSGDLTFWKDRQVIGFLLGAAVPLCIIAGWVIENPLEVRHSGFYKFCAFLSVMTGLVGLSFYIFTITAGAGLGFMIGTGLACFLICALPHTLEDMRRENGPKKNDPTLPMTNQISTPCEHRDNQQDEENEQCATPNGP